MKKLLSLFVLTAMFVPTVSAHFVDYGTDLNGRQCASLVKEDGTCNIIYTNDASLIGDAKSLDVNRTSQIAQPNALTNVERTARQNAVRAQICLIIGC